MRDDRWQPIETAPKNGSVIIVHGGIAYWRDYPEPGWYSLTGFDYPGEPIRWLIDEWQPLPDY